MFTLVYHPHWWYSGSEEEEEQAEPIACDPPAPAPAPPLVVAQPQQRPLGGCSKCRMAVHGCAKCVVNFVSTRKKIKSSDE